MVGPVGGMVSGGAGFRRRGRSRGPAVSAPAEPAPRSGGPRPGRGPGSRQPLLGLLAGLFLLAVVAVLVQPDRPPVDADSIATAGPAATADPSTTYDPYRAGETLPQGYFPILQRDFIVPVYQPAFVPAAEVGWPDDADVIGVAMDGRAKAYPVSFLTFREIVNDELAGTPILVTW